MSNTFMLCVFVLLFFVLCTLCCQFLWIVQFWFLIAPSVFSNVYLDEHQRKFRRLYLFVLLSEPQLQSFEHNVYTNMLQDKTFLYIQVKIIFFYFWNDVNTKRKVRKTKVKTSEIHPYHTDERLSFVYRWTPLTGIQMNSSPSYIDDHFSLAYRWTPLLSIPMNASFSMPMNASP
jgi:hypothetical protein